MRDHVLRNAMVPIITVAGIQLASLLGGVIVVEVLFAWPGLGRVVVRAIHARDLPLVEGGILLNLDMLGVCGSSGSACTSANL